MSDRGDPLLVGVDFGTTNIKAIVFDTRGQVAAQASTATPTRYPRPGRAHYEPEEMWERTAEALRKATDQLDDPARIVSVAFASMGETAVPIDAQGQPTYHAIAWFDPRTKPQADWLGDVIGRDRLFSITGLPLSEIPGLCKALWLQEEEPEAYARTEKWLNVADYLAFRMSGVAATDFSLASRMLALNLRELRWAEDLLAEAGVSPGLFAPLLPSGTGLGPVLPEAAQATGLPRHARVAVGGHDHVCGALAAGVVSPGMALNSIGTAEVLFVPLQEPLADPQLGRNGFESGAHVDGRHFYTFGSIRTSGACVDWYRSLFTKDMGYAELVEEARHVPAGSTGVCFLPHLRSAVTPHFDQKALGAFAGLSPDVDRQTMFRAVLEGTAFEIHDTLQALTPYTSMPVSTIYAIGGGTRNTLLMEIKASVFNTVIEAVDMEEAVALGAAMLGGVAATVYVDVDDAMQRVQHSRTAFEPDAAQAAVYHSLFHQVYRQMYAALRPVSHAIYDFREQSNQR